MADETYRHTGSDTGSKKIQFPGTAHRTGYDDQSMGDDVRAMRNRRKRQYTDDDYIPADDRPKTHLAGEGLYAPTKTPDYLFTGHDERPDRFEDTVPRTKKFVPTRQKPAKKSGLDIDRLRAETEKAKADRRGTVTVINGSDDDYTPISTRKIDTKKSTRQPLDSSSRGSVKTKKTPPRKAPASADYDADDERDVHTTKVKFTPKSGSTDRYTPVDGGVRTTKVKSTPKSGLTDRYTPVDGGVRTTKVKSTPKSGSTDRYTPVDGDVHTTKVKSTPKSGSTDRYTPVDGGVHTTKVKSTPKSGSTDRYTPVDGGVRTTKVKSTPKSETSRYNPVGHKDEPRGGAKSGRGSYDERDAFYGGDSRTSKVKLTVKAGGKSKKTGTFEPAGSYRDGGRRDDGHHKVDAGRRTDRGEADTFASGSARKPSTGGRKPVQSNLDDYFGGTEANAARKPDAKKKKSVPVRVVNSKRPEKSESMGTAEGYHAFRQSVDKAQKKEKKVRAPGETIEIPFAEIFGMGIGKQIIAIILIAVIGLGLYLVVPRLSKAVFKVASIRVTGDTQYDRDEIIASSKIVKGMSLEAVSANKAESYIELSNPYVDAEIDVGMFGGVTISVKDRVPYVLVDCGDKNLIVDSEFIALGFVEKDDTEFADYIVLRGIGAKNFKLAQKTGDPDTDYKLSCAKAVLDEIERGHYAFTVTEIDVLNCNRIICSVSDNIYVILGNCEDISDKLARAAQVLPVVISGDTRAEIDVRVETRYRFINAAQSAPQTGDSLGTDDTP